MKNSIDPIRSLTCYLPACHAIPPPTASPCTLSEACRNFKIFVCRYQDVVHHSWDSDFGYRLDKRGTVVQFVAV
jgi:hypothetical protein